MINSHKHMHDDMVDATKIMRVMKIIKPRPSPITLCIIGVLSGYIGMILGYIFMQWVGG